MRKTRCYRRCVRTAYPRRFRENRLENSSQGLLCYLATAVLLPGRVRHVDPTTHRRQTGHYYRRDHLALTKRRQRRQQIVVAQAAAGGERFTVYGGGERLLRESATDQPGIGVVVK